MSAGTFKLTLEVGSRQWGGSAWDLDLDIGRFNEDIGTHEGEIRWDIRRSTGAPKDQRSNRADVQTAIRELLAAKEWKLTKTEIKHELGGSTEAFTSAFAALQRSGEIDSCDLKRDESGTTKTRKLLGTGANPRPTPTVRVGPGRWNKWPSRRGNNPVGRQSGLSVRVPRPSVRQPGSDGGTPIGPGSLVDPAPCRYCGDPTWLGDEDGPLHPCCRFWMVEQGWSYCWACRIAKAGRRRSAPERMRTSGRSDRATEANAVDQGRHDDAWDALWVPGTRPSAPMSATVGQIRSSASSTPSIGCVLGCLLGAKFEGLYGQDGHRQLPWPIGPGQDIGTVGD